MSGRIATGKTAVAVELARRNQATLVRVRAALAEMTGADPDDRAQLQMRGSDLDTRTAGRWLFEYVADRTEANSLVVVDSVRTRRQTLPILERIVDSRLYFLEAPEATRRQRYTEASLMDPLKASVPFDTAMNHPTEVQVVDLVPLADQVIETDSLSVDAVVDEIQGQTFDVMSRPDGAKTSTTDP
jgi:hypothetical protein